jgi:hypothetical protein
MVSGNPAAPHQREPNFAIPHERLGDEHGCPSISRSRRCMKLRRFLPPAREGVWRNPA